MQRRLRSGPASGRSCRWSLICALSLAGCVSLWEDPTPRDDEETRDGGDRPRDAGGRVDALAPGVDALASDGSPVDDGAGACVTADVGARAPDPCNGVDDDCDGVVDEGGGEPEPCTAGLGLCQRAGVMVCVGGEATCDAAPGAASDEVCNAIDDDCDGAVDEPFAVESPCAVGVGRCQREGTIACVNGEGVCFAQPGEPVDERCNGLDDDCDGALDESEDGFGLMGVGWRCRVGEGGRVSTGRMICDVDEDGRRCLLDGERRVERCNGFDDDGDGQLDEGCRATAIDTHGHHTCAVQDDGTIDCWGRDAYGAGQPPDGARFDRVATGSDHTCARRVAEDGAAIECWGRPRVGLLTPPGGAQSELCAGQGFSCAIEAGAGVLRCWGDHAGAGPVDNSDEVWTALTCGWANTCAARGRNGVARCWNEEHPLPDVAWAYDDLAVSLDHGCGVTRDGALVCWGEEMPGAPEGLTLGPRLGAHLGCGLTSDPAGEAGRPWCRWRDAAREARDGYAWPAPDGMRFTALAAHDEKRCGITDDGRVRCWGPEAATNFVPPVVDRPLRTLSAGLSHVCGLTDAGEPVCWGSPGSPMLTAPPGAAEPPLDAIAPGRATTCALTGGRVRCWGWADDPLVTGPPVADDPPTYDTLVCAGHLCCARRQPADPAPGALAPVDCWGDDAALAAASDRFAGDWSRLTASYEAVCVTRPGEPPACAGVYAGPPGPPDGDWLEAAAGGTTLCVSGADPDAAPGSDARIVRCVSDGDAPPVEGLSLRDICMTGSSVVCGTDTRTGLVRCRQGGEPGPTALVPPDVPLDALVCGRVYACGLDAEGRPYCWGAL